MYDTPTIDKLYFYADTATLWLHHKISMGCTKQSRAKQKRVKAEASLYPSNEYKIMKLKINNIRA